MNTRIILSDIDRDHFLESLKNPPEPFQKMKELFENYKKKGK